MKGSVSNWTWGFSIGVCAVFAYLSYSYKDGKQSTLLFLSFKAFLYAVFGYIGWAAISKIASSIFPRQQHHLSDIAEERKASFNKRRVDRSSRLQTTSDEKTEDYKERILVPRELQRQQRKEEKLQNVIGPEFKGHGNALGGSGFDKDNNVTANDQSREHRQLPASVRQHIPASEGKPVKKKRVIELPEEPGVDEDDVITITIHTVFDQRYSRRFYSSTQLQVVFDYMTILGFSTNIYTLAWSHPRIPLDGDVHKTLQQLNFDKRMLLFVQEKYSDDED